VLLVHDVLGALGEDHWISLGWFIGKKIL